MILFFLISAVIMVNCSSPARSIEEVVAMDKEIHLGIITYTDYFPFFIQYKNIGKKRFTDREYRYRLWLYHQ